MTKKMDDATRLRVKVGRLLLASKGCAEVAHAIGIHGRLLLDESSIDALRAVGGHSRPAQLDARQLDELRRCLLDSRTQHGFGTELWTHKRCVC